MNEFKYTGEIEELDEDEERIPEVKENEISEKLAIGGLIGIALWVFIFMMLRTTGFISGFVMRLCIYPVIGIIFVLYAVVKYRNSRY